MYFILSVIKSGPSIGFDMFIIEDFVETCMVCVIQCALSLQLCYTEVG